MLGSYDSVYPVVSPPATPPSAQFSNADPSPAPSDSDSSLYELSFTYERNAAGDYVRVSKGSAQSTHSSPPTPTDEPDKPPSPSANSPLQRLSLARSESLPSVASSPQDAPPAQPSNPGPSIRSFQRVQSGPIIPTLATPGASILRGLVPTASTGLNSTGRKLGGARRVKLDEYRETNDRLRAEEEVRQREQKSQVQSQNPDKENLLANARQSYPVSSSSSVAAVALDRATSLPSRASALPSSSSLQPRPLLDVPVSQRGLAHGRQVAPGSGRAGRVLKKSSQADIGKIVEMEDGQNVPFDYEPDPDDANPPQSAPGGGLGGYHAYAAINSAALLTAGTRPRRSASLSEGSEDRVPPYDRESGVTPHQYPQSRPASSLGMSGKGPRRVTLEEKIQQERKMAYSQGYALREAEEAAEYERRSLVVQMRKSPSPPHAAHAYARPQYSHQRRDSDTLRSMASTPAPPSSGSPTVMEMPPPRSSPPGRYGQSITPGLAMAAANNAMRHRRSPTAPEPGTTSGMIAPPGLSGTTLVKTWSANDGKGKDQMRDANRDRDRDRDADNGSGSSGGHGAPGKVASSDMQPPAPRLKPAQSLPTQTAPGLTDRGRNLIVNKKVYARLDMIGKGGSSRVYRVINGANEIYAIKRVALDKTDADTMNGYMNEIALLKRLEGNSRIIRLIDSELKPGPAGSKGHLLLVMECGEIDLARLLQEQQREAVDLVWIASYWKQMLQAVHIIHEEKIVHSDLKPANFVLVKGQLKLIDFGIANAIANDTTNIQRDHQIGTVNYMSPEAIELPDGMRRLKVGRASDVWSLGCILYQMVYGHPPFHHLSVFHKMKAIPDENHIIEFPMESRPPHGDSSPSRPSSKDPPSVPVPESVIEAMRGCLARNHKARPTIPHMLERGWLAMHDPKPSPPPSPPPPPPPPPPFLGEKETIINPYFMEQLLIYGIGVGQSGRHLDAKGLKDEAERLVAELKTVHASSAPGSNR